MGHTEEDGKLELLEEILMKKRLLAMIPVLALIGCINIPILADASGKNSADPEEWEMVAALDLTDDQLLEIYDLWEEGLDKESLDWSGEEVDAYEDQLAEEIADKYDITAEDANMVYFCLIMDYDRIASGAKGQNPSKIYKLEHGEFISANSSGSTIVIKAKIEPSWTNELTINQNYFNIIDLIQNQGLNTYKEIQYWAVADMTSGDEAKVISFTVPQDVIEYLAENDFSATELGQFLDDLWIHPSLQQ